LAQRRYESLILIDYLLSLARDEEPPLLKCWYPSIVHHSFMKLFELSVFKVLMLHKLLYAILECSFEVVADQALNHEWEVLLEVVIRREEGPIGVLGRILDCVEGLGHVLVDHVKLGLVDFPFLHGKRQLGHGHEVLPLLGEDLVMGLNPLELVAQFGLTLKQRELHALHVSEGVLHSVLEIVLQVADVDLESLVHARQHCADVSGEDIETIGLGGQHLAERVHLADVLLLAIDAHVDSVYLLLCSGLQLSCALL
jgi:hypothetical protein